MSRHLSVVRDVPGEPERAPKHDDGWLISDEDFEFAKAEAVARFGALPPTLQRVVDRGGRFARSGRRARIEEEFDE